jgi:hypothetical protein
LHALAARFTTRGTKQGLVRGRARRTAKPGLVTLDRRQEPFAAAIAWPLKTIAEWKAHQMSYGEDPRFVEKDERAYDCLRKAGMPEGEAKTN